MIKNLEIIDDCMNGNLSPEEIKELDKQIINDPEMAEDAAFYIAVCRAIGLEARADRVNRFRNLATNKP